MDAVTVEKELESLAYYAEGVIETFEETYQACTERDVPEDWEPVAAMMVAGPIRIRLRATAEPALQRLAWAWEAVASAVEHDPRWGRLHSRIEQTIKRIKQRNVPDDLVPFPIRLTVEVTERRWHSLRFLASRIDPWVARADDPTLAPRFAVDAVLRHVEDGLVAPDPDSPQRRLVEQMFPGVDLE